MVRFLKPSIRIIVYFLLTFTWSWTFWGIALWLNKSLSEWYIFLLYALGGIAPSTIGIILSFFYNKEEQLEYWHRFTDLKRMSVLWIFISILGPILLILITILLDMLVFGHTSQFNAIIENFQNPIGVLGIVGFGIIAVFIEEFGWRGYSLPELLKVTNPALSSTILGLIWSCWHIPLFFVQDTYQFGLGVFTLEFYVYLIETFVFTFIITFVFQKTMYSLVSVMLLHFSNNIAGELFGPNSQMEIIRLILYLILMISIIVFWSFESKKKKKIKA
jgi:membrane protease YdiL (CAAX protease family)